MSSSSESLTSYDSVYSEAKYNDEYVNNEYVNDDINKSAEMRKIDVRCERMKEYIAMNASGASLKYPVIFADTVAKIRKELNNSLSNKDDADTIPPMLCEKEKKKTVRKPTKACTRSRGMVAMNKDDADAVINPQHGTNNDDATKTGCDRLYVIARFHLGKGCVQTAMFNNLVLRQKVFDQAYKEGGGPGYRFNRVTVSGTGNVRRPATLVKYVE